MPTLEQLLQAYEAGEPVMPEKYAGATQGKWHWIKLDEEHDEPVGSLHGDKECIKECIMDFGDNTQYYPTSGMMPRGSDKELITDAKDLAAQNLILRKALEQIKVAILSADDAFGSLKRGFGPQVTALCYPAKNDVSDAFNTLARVSALIGGGE